MRIPSVSSVLGMLVWTMVSTNAQDSAVPAVHPANAWMKTPTLHTAHDSLGVPSQIRMERDHYWDTSFAASPTPLSPGTASLTATSTDYGPGRKEIPDLPYRAIVVANFTNAQSILTASGRCVYTYINFQVEQVFEHINHDITPKSLITVSVSGGTVLTASGQIIWVWLL
jgi:hypothetical protein